MIKFIPIAIIFFLVGCNTNQQEKSETDLDSTIKSFEGIITYDVSIEVKDSFLAVNNAQYYQELYGNKAIIYINDDGSIFRRFPNSGSDGYYSRGFNVEQNVIYEEFMNYDSVLIWNAAQSEWVLVNKEEGELDTICDLPCTSIKYAGYEKGGDGDTLSFKYFYSSNLYLNPEPYKNWKENFSGEILQIMKSYMLSYEVSNPTYTLRMRAVNIEHQEINDTLFDLPTHKPFSWR